MDIHSALMFEIEVYNRLPPTEDRREGVLAFNEKRKPVFKDGSSLRLGAGKSRGGSASCADA